MSQGEYQDIGRLVEAYFRSQRNLTSKLVVDLPAGTGRMSRTLRDLGATVESYDLYPECFEVEGMACRLADLAQPLPIPSGHADYVVFQEGLEHLPDQLRPLREFNRILKLGGRLVLTTPNPSCLRARLCHFLTEGYLFNRLPINECSAIRMLDPIRRRYYFGHVFLISAQRLRILASIAGFRIAGIHSNRFSKFSMLLGVTYPALLLFNSFAYLKTRQRYRRLDPAWLRQTLGEVLALNLNPRILFAKKLLLEFEKMREADEAGAAIFERSRRSDGLSGRASVSELEKLSGDYSYTDLQQYFERTVR